VTVLLNSSEVGQPNSSEVGQPNELGSGGVLVLRQGAGGLPGQAEAGDRFGSSVTGGSEFSADGNRFDGDAEPDVAVGAGAGAVSIIYSYQYFEHERLLWQGHAGIGGTAEPGDAFGAAVA
jgi:hypothetical protein